MKNNVSLFVLLAFMLCIGCEGKKEEGHGQISEYVKYYTINEKDFQVWDGLVVDSDFTIGPHGNANHDVILTAETAAMVGEALIRSALRDRHVEENIKTVIDRSKYWIVQGTVGSSHDDAMFAYIAVIQKSNGKVLDFRIVEK